jgi:hypothetical protein
VISTKQLFKGTDEKRLFQLFLIERNLSFAPEQIESRQPPEPDIVYFGDNETVAFELVENCGAEVAHNIALLAKGGGSGIINTSDPTVSVIRSKLAKSYQSEYPVELLCYANGRIATPNDMAIKRMSREIKSAKLNPFRRVWYFGKQSKIYTVWKLLD